MYRILHFVSNVATRSGVLSVIMNYYKYVDRKKIQFDFVYFDEFENNYIEEIESLGGRTFKVKRPSNVREFAKEFNDLLRVHRGEFEVLHNHEVYMTFIIDAIAKKNGVKNIIVHSHATRASDDKRKSLRNRILCLPVPYLSVERFACSQAAGKFLYGDKPFYVLNNAIDVEKYRYSEKKRSEIRGALALNDKLVIGHVGRFNDPKNHTFLIDIFKEIIEKNKSAILLLVGDGPLQDGVKEKVDDLNLSNNVVFMGNRKDVPDLLQAMDIFVLPSLYEGFPVVGVEAQCAGLPVFMSTAITREVDLVDVVFIDLAEDADIWAKEILEKAVGRVERTNAYKVVAEKKYDISQEAHKMTERYIQVIEKM